MKKKNVVISFADFNQLNRDLGYCIGLLTGVENRIDNDLKNVVKKQMKEIRERQVPEILDII